MKNELLLRALLYCYTFAARVQSNLASHQSIVVGSTNIKLDSSALVYLEG